MYGGTFNISNVCRYIFESADGISGSQWPRFNISRMYNMFVIQKLDAYNYFKLAGVSHNARV